MVYVQESKIILFFLLCQPVDWILMDATSLHTKWQQGLDGEDDSCPCPRTDVLVAFEAGLIHGISMTNNHNG